MGHLAPKSVSVAQCVMIRKWVSYQESGWDVVWQEGKQCLMGKLFYLQAY